MLLEMRNRNTPKNKFIKKLKVDIHKSEDGREK
jgi:hypothetical protein